MRQAAGLRKIFAADMPAVYYELLFIGFSIMMGMSLSSSFLPILANDLDPSGVLVGMVVSAWFLSRIFMELPAGIISDRIGRRRMLVFGLGLSLLGPLLCSQAANIHVLILARALWGMGTALYFMSNMALLMDILPQSTRGKALGMFQGIEFLGSFIGAPVGAFLAVYFSYSQVFYFTFAFTIISLVLALRSKNMVSLETQGPKSKLALKQITGSLRDKGIIIVCFINAFRTLVTQGIHQTVLQLYLNQQVGLTVAGIGWVVSSYVLGQVFALPAAGNISDRFGRKPVLMVGFFIRMAGLALFTVSTNLIVLLVSGLVSGIGEGLTMTTLMALLTDIVPQTSKGGAVGLYRTFMDIGGFLGPLVFMVAYENYSPLAPFYAAAGLCALSMVLTFFTRTKPSAST